MFLKKAEGRTGFNAVDENGTELPLPTRATCNWVSAVAMTEASRRIVKATRKNAKENGERRVSQPNRKDLEYVLHCAALQQPYDASVILNELLQSLDPAMKRAWGEQGLIGDLKMLVEHGCCCGCRCAGYRANGDG